MIVIYNFVQIDIKCKIVINVFLKFKSAVAYANFCIYVCFLCPSVSVYVFGRVEC